MSRVGLLAALAVLLFTGSALSRAPGPDSPVADAAMRGDVETVRELLDAGADVDAAQGDGMTALHWAAINDDARVAQVLIEAGASIDRGTRIGDYTPLHLASRSASGEVVGMLLHAGADPRAPSGRHASTPLHLAAASGSVEAVEALLSAGAVVDAREAAWGQTPLMFAATAGRTGAVRALLTAGADPSLTTRVIDVARLTRERQEARRERNRRMSGMFNEGAAAAPATEAERDALEASEDEEEEAQRPIEEPEPLSYGELVGEQGGMTALLHAAREGHTDAALLLLASGAGIDQASGGDSTTPLLIALINGHFDLAAELIERGADVTLASDAGTTPLYAVLNTHWAPKSRYPQQHAFRQQQIGYLELAERILDAGADVNARLSKHLWFVSFNFDLLQVDTRGATPFWRAAYALDIEAMEFLLERGADPTIATQKVPARRYGSRPIEPDPSGLPPVPVGGPAVAPIHAASGVGYGQGFAANAHRHVPDGWLDAVRYLVVEVGADVNQRDHNGYTALHHAASRGDVEMIRYLVEQGADVTVVSREGQTTADMANGPYQRIQPFPEAVRLLESLGSKNNHNCVSC